MAKIDSLLVTDNSLQQYIVDKTLGTPLAGGIVTFYIDNGGSALKNIYEQTGPAGGPYTFAILPNPLTLSSVGTFVDPSGNDIEVFYYPYDESSSAENPPVQKYHVKVVSSTNADQFDRYNFPWLGTGEEPANINAYTNQNLIVNNEFWRNIGSSFTAFNAVDTVTGTSHTTLAPSQHDGFYFPDIQVIKNNPAVDSITFGQFTPGSIPTGWENDIVPEFYLDYTANGSDTFRCIQIPISLHLLTLGGTANCTLTFQARGISGSPTIAASIYTNAGTGSAFSSTTNIIPATALTSDWVKYTNSIAFTFPPSIALADLGAGGDDAFYLQLILPTSSAFELQIAKPSVFLSPPPAPVNDFSSYDVIDSVINSPRTGDVRTSLNSFAPFGWIAANDSTIGYTGSGAATIAGTWPLYNLLWNSVNNTFAPVAGGRGATAYGDFFTSAKAMTIPLMLGRALLGLPPAFNVTSYTAGSAPSWNSGQNGFFTLSDTTLLYVGAPVILTGTSLNAAFTSGNLYYAIPAIDGSDTTTLQLATSYANAIAGIGNAIAASGGGTGTSIVLTMCLAGSMGEARHKQLNPELALHTHDAPAGGNFVINAAGGLYNTAGASLTTAAQTGNIHGLSGTSPFNIVQPSIYLNVFLKL